MSGSTATAANAVRQNQVIGAILVLVKLGVFSPKEAQEEMDMLHQYGGFGVFATIGDIVYNISGMAVGSDSIEIEVVEPFEIIRMKTIEEFEGWVKTLLADQEPEVSASVVADP